MAVVRTVKRCIECGQVSDVLAARVDQVEIIVASGGGRCADCGSQRLSPAPDVEAMIDDEPGAIVWCPRCEAPLAWSSTGGV